MAQDRARARQLKVVRGRPAEMTILDLAHGVRIYLSLLNQSRELTAVMEDLRQRLLQAMQQARLAEFSANGAVAIRQVRRLPPRLDTDRAERILEREGRLQEAQRTVLDPDKATEILEELRAQGKLRREQIPYTEEREVEVLIVRPTEAET